MNRITRKQIYIDFDGDGSKTSQVSWDEELCSWAGHIYDDVFPLLLTGIEYETMIIVMEQCFSGGLIPEMAQGGNDRIIISAAGEYEPSWVGPEPLIMMNLPTTSLVRSTERHQTVLL
jgi:hypothetical protein